MKLKTTPVEAPKPERQKLSPEQEARLKEFQNPDSDTFRRWQSGDQQAIAERDSLFQAQYPGKVEIT